ncbi:UDP-4-amino-4-deoxy-L-arabinose--oxoglutarate aminotransferase [Sedimentisphaera cyanobacteriorum]|uniref:UDP-4-amino-4-deoxy-L-arabinose--oxoglutarate aminotransferase n=1 Tax=Sedimentisphaera cyanobacteriorum TaxID=1940790 RepID=A0A1Q2HMR5_9BACT|nr:DegT/DnrJ/EryC1/StrS family aminotransferase [Sedimentisphaera cyanobacteriorum]AQQ08829.1 UDP-4-amino-4-deoxy-L-arabinose--oxoglutarate aminotransferase [Sedimentisphaera cyanobacteriorum]
MNFSRIELSAADITDTEIQAVTEVLKSGKLSLGPKLAEFEEAVKALTGAKYAVAVNSGTSGLFLCLKAMGIGPGDEVITTPFTFIASVNVILQAGAKPVFADIHPDYLNMNPDLIDELVTPKTKAIEAVHAFGNPWGIDEVQRIARERGLMLIEDSCEAIGTVYKSIPAGMFGDAGFFAFYPNKQITTGEGGIIITDNPELADLCRSLRNQGRSPDGGWLSHERVGYNFRLSDINCALGTAQLSRFAEIKMKRSQAAGKYIEKLNSDKRLIMPQLPDNCDFSWFVFVVRLTEDCSLNQRNELLDMLKSEGVCASNYFPPVHLQPFIKAPLGIEEGSFPVTESVSSRTVALPFHSNLSDEKIDFVCEKLSLCLDRL